MNVAVEELNTCQKKLTISLSAEEIDKEYQAVLREIRRDVTLPGFRKGKASISTIKRRFSKEIKNQVKENLLEDSLKDALVQENISPIGTPDLDVKKISFQEHKSAEYDVTVEHLPPLEITEYTGVEVPKPETPEVSEDSINQTLEGLQRQNAINEPVDDEHRIEEQDSVTIDYARTLDGEPLEEPVKDYTFWLGVDQVIPELHDHVIGRRKGDEITFPLQYGEDIEDQRIAGKTVDFTVTIVNVEKVVLPELDDEFAKDLEEETLEDLKKKIEADIQARLEKSAIQATKHEILMKLADKYVFDIPPSILNEQQKSNPEKDEAELCRMLRAGIILSKIEAQEKITVDDDEIDAHLQVLAQQNHFPVAAIRNLLAQQGGLERIHNDLLEQKTLTFLYEHANLTEGK
jgi:trigger factor